MAKKSNKTEQVLRLITKNEKSAGEDAFYDIRQEPAASESLTAMQAVIEPPEQSGGLVNIAEILAREKVGLVMNKMKVCTCETCVNDVLALTLNSLPTKYVPADEGREPLKRDGYKKQYDTEILAALTKACVRVKASPRHQEQK